MFPLIKTLSSLLRARLISLMFLCAFMGLVIVVAAVSGLSYLSAILINTDIPYLSSALHWLMGGVFTILGWFMLPAFIVLISGIFQETTISRVEQADYPDKVRTTPPRFWPDFVHDIRFTLWALFLNILVLPFYLAGIGPVLAVLLNSYLLGREYFESAAGYHMGKAKAKKLSKYHGGAVYFGGFVITALTITPFVNLFAPIIALVWMVHIYHSVEPLPETEELNVEAS